MGSKEALELQIKLLEERNNQLCREIEKERQARAAATDLLRKEKIKNARASAHIACLNEQLKSAQRSLEDAQSNIANGMNCFQAANSSVTTAQKQLGSAVAYQPPEVPQNSRSMIILPTHGDATQSKLLAKVNPMVQGVQIRKPSVHLFRLSSSVLLDYRDNAASSSAAAATAMTPPSQQAAVPQVSLGNELSFQEPANTTMSSDSDFVANGNGGTTSMENGVPRNLQGRPTRRSFRLQRH